MSDRTGVYKMMNRRNSLDIDIEGGVSGTGQIKQYADWNSPDDRQLWKIFPSPQTTKRPVPVVVELFHHPLGRTADHTWTKEQRSVLLTTDTPLPQRR